MIFTRRRECGWCGAYVVKRVLTYDVFGKRRVRQWLFVFECIADVQSCSRTQCMFTRALSFTRVFMHDTFNIICIGAGARGRMYQMSYVEL